MEYSPNGTNQKYYKFEPQYLPSPNRHLYTKKVHQSKLHLCNPAVQIAIFKKYFWEWVTPYTPASDEKDQILSKYSFEHKLTTVSGHSRSIIVSIVKL